MDEQRSGGHFVTGRYPAAEGPDFTEYLGIRCRDDVPPCELSGLRALTLDLIGALGYTFAYVDAFSDCATLPPTAAQSRDALVGVANLNHQERLQQSRWYRWLRRKGPTLMGIELDLGEAAHREVATEFAPYSIHALVGSEDGTGLLLHDSGSAVTLVVRREETDAVQRMLASHGADVDVVKNET